MIVDQIPFLLAMRLSDEPEMHEGETRPLKMHCQAIKIDGTLDIATLYVVKLRCKLGDCKIVKEIYANLLANYFDINTPEAALIDISPVLVQAVMENHFLDTSILSLVSESEGTNYGSRYLGTQTSTPLSVSKEKLVTAADIFAFDALIWNSDRCLDTYNGLYSPNVFEYNESYWVYDHERAFQFTGLENSDAHFLCVNSDGNNILNSHIFFPHLKGKNQDFSGFFEKLNLLSDDIILGFARCIPMSLRNDSSNNLVSAIGEHLKLIRNDSQRFQYHLMGMLT